MAKAKKAAAKHKVPRKASARPSKTKTGGAETVHTFGRTRPSQSGKWPIHTQPERDTHFRPLPPSTGKPPYRLDLKSILPSADYQAIVAAKRLVFHLNGGMGGIKTGIEQTLVAKGMEQDFREKGRPADNPAFLYILGDCVYYNGEIKEYYSQFYEPYEFFPRPIFAVPGNHDGENLPGGQPLDGFLRNFCAPAPVKMPEAQDSNRTAMTQPNVYWTLLTPLVSIVGLYSNVPAGGEIASPQTEWLVEELKSLPDDLPILVALHHPVYSADNHHSGSTAMKKVIEDASEAAGRHPDMVLAGHVHNFQRLTKTMPDGTQIPYIVAGAGGYYHLHSMMKVGYEGEPETMIPPVTFPDKQGDPVTLERYCSDHHGFVRMEVTEKLITGRYYSVPRPHDPYSKPSQLVDYFEFDWKKKRLIPNTLPTPSVNEVSVSVKGRRASPEGQTARRTASAARR
jgi:hypothetical protein